MQCSALDILAGNMLHVGNGTDRNTHELFASLAILARSELRNVDGQGTLMDARN